MPIAISPNGLQKQHCHMSRLLCDRFNSKGRRINPLSSQGDSCYTGQAQSGLAVDLRCPLHSRCTTNPTDSSSSVTTIAPAATRYLVFNYKLKKKNNRFSCLYLFIYSPLLAIVIPPREKHLGQMSTHPRDSLGF